jgi:hypothetical protein
MINNLITVEIDNQESTVAPAQDFDAYGRVASCKDGIIDSFYITTLKINKATAGVNGSVSI